MKNIIITIVALIALTSCGNDNVENTNSYTSNSGEITKKEEKIEVKTEKIQKSENKVLNEINDDKVGLKNASSDDLDKILLEEIRLLNTPTSEYPFFKQSSTKKADINDIKKAGGLEITRGNIFLHGIGNKYSFLNTVLNDNEKLYSFNQNDYSFFYLDIDINSLISKIKTNFSDFIVITNGKEFKDITFTNKGTKYSLQISIANSSNRDDFDSIFQINTKSKVSISSI